jgi:pilus assembly protein FimV
MPIQRHWRLLLARFASGCTAVLVAVLTPTWATAAGFGASGSGAVLGQPLDFVVQVRLDAGEALTAECVSAEVTAGEQRLLPSNVRTVIEMQTADLARVRVQTTQALDEPVVGVNLTVGCASKLSRRFVVLADPPGMAASSAPVPTVVAAPLVPAATGGAAPGSSANSNANANANAGKANNNPSSASAPRGVAKAPRPPIKRATPVIAVAPAKPPVPAGVAAPAPAPAPSGVRLKLDFVEPPPSATPVAAAASAQNAAVEQALNAVAQAASAARSAAVAASAAAERITGLERTVEQLRTEAKTSRDVNTQLRERLAQVDSPSGWTLLLMALAGLLAALSAWLAWRLGRVQGQRQQGWSQAMSPDGQGQPGYSATASATLAASRLPTGAMPFSSTVEPTLPPLSGQSRPGRQSVPAWPPASPANADSTPPDTWPPKFTDSSAMSGALSGGQDGPNMRTQPHPRHAVDLEVAARDVSIEELIDLEQQAEFFVVLGQDEAAIDLLVDHLRSTGGSSPLPYLKLLEIYRRRGDHPAYERMRARFNHRFNAYAPDWDTDLQHGRSLDDYASVMPRLLQVWPRPLDAMAELEALLFRKSRGELFDLPAYREVLFLYSLARDLLDRESADTGSVDLLLPLADGGEFSSTAPAPFASDTQIREGRMDYDDRPTAPVDFDLTQPPPQSSIFEEEPVRPRRR